MCSPRLAALLVVFAGLPIAAADPVADKLDGAKAAYEADLKRIRKDVLDSLDKREEVARRDGKRAAVERIKAERQAYLESEEVPPPAVATWEEKVTAARAQMEAAYKAAIKEYTTARQDDEAAGIDKALSGFRRELWRFMDIETATLKDDYVQIPKGALITTKKEYSGAVEMVVVARTEAENIRLYGYRGSGVIFNWEVNPRELRVNRPDGESDRRESGSIATAQVAPLRPNTWYRLRWRITPVGTQVYVNDHLVFSELRANDLSTKGTFAIAAPTSKVDVKAVRFANLPDK
jgi:hypothetical protein